MYSRSSMVSQLGIPCNLAITGNIEMLRLEIKCTMCIYIHTYIHTHVHTWLYGRNYW